MNRLKDLLRLSRFCIPLPNCASKCGYFAIGNLTLYVGVRLVPFPAIAMSILPLGAVSFEARRPCWY